MSFAAVVFVSLVTTAAGQSATAPAAPSAQPAAASAQATPASDQGQPQKQSQNQTQSPHPGEPLPVSFDRIRKALDESPTATGPRLKVDTTDTPVFRIHTEGARIVLSSILDDGTSVPAYIRPPNGPYDYEFKQMVTPDAVKGCGRLSQTECLQYVANGIASGLLFQHATQKKKASAPSTPAPPDAETLRIRAQIQQELLDQQAAASAEKPKPNQP